MFQEKRNILIIISPKQENSFLPFRRFRINRWVLKPEMFKQYGQCRCGQININEPSSSVTRNSLTYTHCSANG